MKHIYYHTEVVKAEKNVMVVKRLKDLKIFPTLIKKQNLTWSVLRAIIAYLVSKLKARKPEPPL